MGKKKSFGKRVAVGIGSGIIALSLLASQASYTVKQVIDGDSFITKENVVVRLDSVNAPEKDLCLGKEAKEELEKLVLGKKVFIKVTYIDGYKRIVGSVFTLKGNIGAILLSKGLATFTDKGNQNQSRLLQISQESRNKKLGIYSETCTQLKNIKNPECNIKANINSFGAYYRYPGCKYYDTTLIQLHLGDKWFCTVKEAAKDGFKIGKDCK